jgi:lipooligosaccharide transport system permease protein
MTGWWGIRCVWLRYFDVYRKSLFYSVVTTFVEPMLYLIAFGFGLGGLIKTLQIGNISVSYRQFIFAGIVGQTILFQSFFEAAYGSFIRMYYQRVFQAIATTPITLSEVLWAELIWDASKATFASSAVLLIGTVMGDFTPLGAMIALPLCFLCSFIFAGLGILVAARSRTIEDISYPQYLLIFPMFLFCGIFFPLENLPKFFQWIAWALPLTSVISLLRTLTLQLPFQIQALPLLAVWLVILVLWSRRAMTRRLVK